MGSTPTLSAMLRSHNRMCNGLLIRVDVGSSPTRSTNPRRFEVSLERLVARSASGQGREVFTLEARVRIPYA